MRFSLFIGKHKPYEMCLPFRTDEFEPLNYLASEYPDQWQHIRDISTLALGDEVSIEYIQDRDSMQMVSNILNRDVAIQIELDQIDDLPEGVSQGERRLTQIYYPQTE